MRTIDYATSFRRDYRRVKANPRYRNLDNVLLPLVTMLAEDQALAVANRDHALSGNWSSYRECHVRPDLLLIYRKPDTDTLQIARLGSHSELFG